MARDPEIEIVSITSNTQALSEKVIHDSLVNMLKDELLLGEAFLAGIVPKREGDMAAHVGHRIDDKGIEIEGAVGIPEIHKTGESDVLSGQYPLFVDKGTGIFNEHGTIFPKEKQFMYIPPERGIPGWLRSSKGQPGQHFMFATFSMMVSLLEMNGQIWKADLAAKLNADKSLT